MALENILKLCGFAHIALGVGSLAIPKLLNWKAAFSNMPVLLKQMFWTYAGYILFINFFFGIISVFVTEELLQNTSLSLSLTLLITLYWAARLVIQFTYFDQSELPQRMIFKVGEILLISLFILFTTVYGYISYIKIF